MCECSHFEHVPVFPWDDGELLLYTSSSLCGGGLLSSLKTNFLRWGFLSELCLYIVTLFLNMHGFKNNHLLKFSRISLHFKFFVIPIVSLCVSLSLIEFFSLFVIVSTYTFVSLFETVFLNVGLPFSFWIIWLTFTHPKKLLGTIRNPKSGKSLFRRWYPLFNCQQKTKICY